MDMENSRRLAFGLAIYKDYAELELAEKEEETELKNDSMVKETGEILTDWFAGGGSKQGFTLSRPHL
jgi:hypothetical protein